MVIKALAKTKLDYLILQKTTLFDANGALIDDELHKAVQPVLEGEFVELTCLLKPGV